MITFMRRLPLLVLSLVTAFGASANSVVSTEELVENPRYSSADKRFCAVMRLYEEVGDFESRPAGIATGREATGGGEPVYPATTTIAFYDRRELLSVFEIPNEYTAQILVSDSGSHVVAIAGSRMFPAFYPDDLEPFAAIYRADGTLVRTLTAGDVFSTGDRESIDNSLQPVFSVDRDLLFVRLPSTLDESRHGYIRIELATGDRLDPKRDIYPPHRTWATPSNGAPLGRSWTAWSCIDPAAVRISSKQLYARAVHRPPPVFPVIAKRVKLQTIIRVEMVVSETGRVICTRFTAFPFGIDQAVLAAVREWRFEPYLIDGRAVPVTSEIDFHFPRVDHEEWETITSSLPHPPQNPPR